MRNTRGHCSGLRVALLTILASSALSTVIPTHAAQAATLDSEEVALCQTVNAHRAQNGLPPLLVSNSLGNAAEWLSTDMAQKNYFNHVDSLGRDPSRRMAAFGYSYATTIGENIAAGSATGAGTFTQWRNSPPHNANMLNSSYVVMGVGRAYGAASPYGWYWTATFGGFNDGGTPCPALAALTVDNVRVTEGNAGTRFATFTITRAGLTNGVSSVSYLTVNGTATAGADYVAKPLTTVTFAAGETAKTAVVTVNGDTVVEAGETFYLKLRTATGATILDATGRAIIRNDDA